MKQLVIALVVMFGFTFSAKAQYYNKDGSPDMRYKVNKQIYGNSYSQPSFSQPSYSQPSYSQPSYQQPTYSQPSYNNYSQPSYSSPSTYPTYPTKKDGTPDMRYKENKQLYGNPW